MKLTVRTNKKARAKARAQKKLSSVESLEEEKGEDNTVSIANLVSSEEDGKSVEAGKQAGGVKLSLKSPRD